MFIFVNHSVKEYFVSDICLMDKVYGRNKWIQNHINSENNKYERITTENYLHHKTRMYIGTNGASITKNLYIGMMIIDKFGWNLDDVEIIISKCYYDSDYRPPKYKDYKNLTFNPIVSLKKWLTSKEETSSENELNINDYE